MKANDNTLTRRQIRKILKANHGSVTRIAAAVGIRQCSLSSWLCGRCRSRRLEKELPKFALALASGEELDSVIARFSHDQDAGDGGVV